MERIEREAARRGLRFEEDGLAAAARPRQIPAPVLGRMERSFGADFSGVRVVEAPGLEELGVDAAAHGDLLGFAPGRFAPESREGQALLGHELAHVVQQTMGAPFPLTGGAPIVEDRGLELQADRAGERAAAGLPAASELAPMTPGPAPAEGAIQMKKAAKGAKAPEPAPAAALDPAAEKERMIQQYRSSHSATGGKNDQGATTRNIEKAMMTWDMDDRIRATMPKYLVGKVTEEDWERIHNMEENLERARKEDPDKCVGMLSEMGIFAYQGETKFLDLTRPLGLTEPVVYAMQTMLAAGDWIGDPALKDAMRRNIREGMEIEQQYVAPYQSGNGHDRGLGYLKLRTDRNTMRHAGLNSNGLGLISMYLQQYRTTEDSADKIMKNWLGDDYNDMPGEDEKQRTLRLNAVKDGEFAGWGSFYAGDLSEEERIPLKERERQNWSDALTDLLSKPK